MNTTCRHCKQAIEPDPLDEWVQVEDGVVGCGLPLVEAELYAEPA